MKLIKFDENGQGYIDFDLMEKETNKKFVRNVELFVNVLGYIAVNDLDGDRYYSLYLVDKENQTQFKIITFDKNTGDVLVNSFSKIDLDIINNGLQKMGGEFNV